MGFIRKNLTLIVVCSACVAIGAGVGVIASAGAATTTTSSTTSAPAGKHAHAGKARGRGLITRAMHIEAVVETKNGPETITVDRGTVQSVSGQQLTLTEGTKSTTYKTVTITIPSGAKVRVNRQNSSLSSVTKGQRVIVIQTPNRTRVIAHTPH